MLGQSSLPAVDLSMTRIVSIVEAATVTGPMKPLLLLAREESKETAHSERSWVRTVITTTRDAELGHSRSNQFLDAAASVGLPVELCLERYAMDFRAIPRLKKLLEAIRPDIVESHDFKSHLLLWIVRYLLRDSIRFRWIAFHHGYTKMSWKVRLYQQFDRLTLRAADRVVTLCKPFVHVLQRRGVNRAKIHVVTNCIDPEESAGADGDSSQLRAELGLRGEEILLLSVGRLSPEKGHTDLLNALARIKSLPAAPSWKLLIVGDGAERERLIKEARSLGDAVLFLGHRTDPWRFFAIADIFVLSSHSEGSPLVVLEAMAAANAIVATRVGGVPEVLDANNAVLVEPHDAEQLSGALARVLTGRELRLSLGERARRDVQQYVPAAYARSIHGIYDDLMQRQH